MTAFPFLSSFAGLSSGLPEVLLLLAVSFVPVVVVAVAVRWVFSFLHR